MRVNDFIVTGSERPEVRPYSKLGIAIARLSDDRRTAQEDWLSSEMVKLLEPDVFLKAYGNLKCKQEVARILESQGYELAYFPCGKTELRKHNEVISTYEPA